MFESLAKQLRGGVPDRLSSVLGSDLRDTRRAMEVSLPALIGGLRDRANEPGGPDAIMDLLDGPAGQPVDDVDLYLTDTDPRLGASALDQIFGSRGEPALTSLSKASGLSTKLLAQVMSMLGPVVTGWLSQKVADDDMTPSELKRYLDSEAERLDQAGYGKVLALVGGRSTVAPPTSTPPEPAQSARSADPVVVGGGESRQRIVTVSDGGPDYEDSMAVPETPDQISSKSIATSGSVPVLAAAGVGAAAGAAGASVSAPPGPEPTTINPAYHTDADSDMDYGGERSGRSILWWILAGVMLLAAAFFVFRMCNPSDDSGSDSGGEVSTDTEGLQASVDSALASYPNVIAQVTGTTVVLSGRVDTINDKSTAETTVRGIEGITNVENTLVVGNGNTVVDKINGSPDLTKFNAMLEANPDVRDQLLVGQPNTVFVPSDEAFANADQALLSSLEADPAQWKQVLMYHIASNSFSTEELKAGGTFTTLEGEVVTTAANAENNLVLNGIATVILPDQQAEYGSLIHAIDNVLVPPSLGGEVLEVEGGGAGTGAETGDVDTTGDAGGGSLNTELGLGSVTFESGSATMTAEGTAEVDKVVTYMNDNPDVKIEIGGHTDTLGEEEANQTLSQQRADAVKTYMESQGIAADRLTAVGYGETQPLVSPDDTAEQQAQNRRIEFKIIS